jgi:hypothetical protein
LSDFLCIPLMQATRYLLKDFSYGMHDRPAILCQLLMIHLADPKFKTGSTLLWNPRLGICSSV